MWVYWVVMLAVTLLSYYAAMSAQKSQSLSASEIEQPTVSQGDRAGKLFGTRRISNPKVVWVGPTTTKALQK